MFCVWQTLWELRQPCLLRPVPDSGLGPDGVVREALLKAIDATLWEDVERRLIGSSVEPLQDEHLYTTDKWLTTSALQKCIRRGYFDLAERYARSAIRIDAGHAFRRLAIIALEDIGIGDLKLIAATLAVLGDKQRRVRLGEERLAAYLAIQLSKAAKSRLACEMLSLVEYDERKLSPDIGFLSEVELQKAASHEDVGTRAQMVAVHQLYGTDRLASRILTPRKGFGHQGVLRLMIELRSPLILQFVVRRGLSRCHDTLALPFAILGQFLVLDDEFEIVAAKHSLPDQIGDYPEIAYDAHTRLGRFAIRQVATLCREKLQRLPPVNLSNLVFCVEGGLLDRRVSSVAVDRIAADASELEVFGQRMDWTIEDVCSRLGLTFHLAKIRRRAVSSTF